jgi:polyisoprenoid-binding protein YceI
MQRKIVETMEFKRLLRHLQIFALVVVLCGAVSIYFATAQSAMPSQRKMAMASLPDPSTYQIDPVHSFAYFGARHHVVGLVRGRFEKVTGTITSAHDPAMCSVDVTVDIASLTTQNTKRDEDLRSDAYFDAAKFPTMSYKGSGIRRVSGSSWIMDGMLTMHGVTRTVPLTFTYNGVFADSDAADPRRVAFHGMAAVKRADFGMGARDNLDELGILMTPDVQIEIDVEADALPIAK